MAELRDTDIDRLKVDRVFIDKSCDIIQSYYISKLLPDHDAMDFLKRHNAESSKKGK